jgi:hypothetical protein
LQFCGEAISARSGRKRTTYTSKELKKDMEVFLQTGAQQKQHHNHPSTSISTSTGSSTRTSAAAAAPQPPQHQHHQQQQDCAQQRVAPAHTWHLTST